MAPNAAVNLTVPAISMGPDYRHRLRQGTAAIHYDRNLQKYAKTQGNPILQPFTWRSY